MTSVSRRNLLKAGAAGLAGASFLEAPAYSAAGARPLLTHGVQSGDATGDSARGVGPRRPPGPDVGRGQPAGPTSAGARLVRGPVLTPDTDFTGKVRLRGLPSDRTTYYRVRWRTWTARACRLEPLAGALRTAPAGRRDISFVWTGDMAGQGWGINPDLGGYRIFEAMRRRRPGLLPVQRRHRLRRRPAAPRP